MLLGLSPSVSYQRRAPDDSEQFDQFSKQERKERLALRREVCTCLCVPVLFRGCFGNTANKSKSLSGVNLSLSLALVLWLDAGP